MCEEERRHNGQYIPVEKICSFKQDMTREEYKEEDTTTTKTEVPMLKSWIQSKSW